MLCGANAIPSTTLPYILAVSSLPLIGTPHRGAPKPRQPYSPNPLPDHNPSTPPNTPHAKPNRQLSPPDLPLFIHANCIVTLPGAIRLLKLYEFTWNIILMTWLRQDRCMLQDGAPLLKAGIEDPETRVVFFETGVPVHEEDYYVLADELRVLGVLYHVPRDSLQVPAD